MQSIRSCSMIIQMQIILQHLIETGKNFNTNIQAHNFSNKKCSLSESSSSPLFFSSSSLDFSAGFWAIMASNQTLFSWDGSQLQVTCQSEEIDQFEKTWWPSRVVLACACLGNADRIVALVNAIQMSWFVERRSNTSSNFMQSPRQSLPSNDYSNTCDTPPSSDLISCLI